jgi:hypothetical protein
MFVGKRSGQLLPCAGREVGWSCDGMAVKTLLFGSVIEVILKGKINLAYPTRY